MTDEVRDSITNPATDSAITEELEPIINPTEFYHFNLYIPTNNRSKETVELLLDHVFKFHFSDVDVEVVYVEKFNLQGALWQNLR